LIHPFRTPGKVGREITHQTSKINKSTIKENNFRRKKNKTRFEYERPTILWEKIEDR